MRVYKYAVIFYIALFLTGTFAPYILNYSFNFNRDYIQNELNSLKDKRKKIIFFGSSHCEFGIKSEIISKKFNVISHNFCSDHWDKDKKIFTQIYNNLNENDIFIYAKRVPLEQNKEPLINYFLPNLYTDFVNFKYQIFRNKFIQNKKKDNVNEFGDKLSYPIRPEKWMEYNKFSYTQYNLKKVPTLFQNMLDKNVDPSKNFKIKKKNTPDFYLVLAPLLIKKDEKIILSNLIENLDQRNNKNIDEIIPPILIDNAKYFVDPWHVNEKGRELWTDSVVKFLEKKIN